MADPAAEKDLPKRKHPRLKNYDYAAPGAYFLTICVKNRRCLLSTVVGRDALVPPELRLTDLGRVVEQAILATETAYPGVTVDHYVVMPNHVHMLLTIHGLHGEGTRPGGTGASRPTIPRMVQAFKNRVTRQTGRAVWQTSYYDHIIRDEEDYLAIAGYIQTNPARWREDCFYTTEAPP